MDKCKNCRKGLVAFTCKCGKRVCMKHLSSEAHKCEFDFLAQHQKDVAVKNPVVVAAKIEAI